MNRIPDYDDMPAEIDFSAGTRGKFYRPGAQVDFLAKRHSEKAGLMDDLLTGRVRVTPLLEATAP